MSESGGIECPECGGPTYVIKSQKRRAHILRRRRCRACGAKVTSVERPLGSSADVQAVKDQAAEMMRLMIRELGLEEEFGLASESDC